MDLPQVCLLMIAGVAAGGINALAGGGSLITFPALLTVGLPPVTANVSNSVSVCPGYLAAVVGSRADLAGQRRRALSLTPVAVLGTVGGAALLLLTPATAFEAVVPFLVVAAALLLAFQSQVRKLVGHPRNMSPRRRTVSLQVMTGIGCIYGGYFGAALGVMLVACLALVLDEKMARVSAFKNSISATVGVVTVVVYSTFAEVDWHAVAIVAPSTLLGGFMGAKLARLLPHQVLRAFIVSFGFAIGVYLYISK